MDRRLALVVALALATSIASAAIHYPPLALGKKLGDFGIQYSDIVYGVFMDRFSPNLPLNPEKLYRKWFSPSKLLALLSGKPLCPAPYVDYFFEYPPIVGGLWYLTTCVAIRASFGSGVEPLLAREAIEKAASENFLMQAAAIAIAFAFLAAYTYRLVVSCGASWKRALLISFLPSSVMYVAYNWDAIASAFSVASVYEFSRGKFLRSGILVGLSIATKLLAYSLAIAMLYELAQRAFKEGSTRELREFALGLIIGCGIPFLALAAAAPQGFSEMVQHYASWYCENCIYLPILKNPAAPSLHVVALVTMVLALSLALCPSMRECRCTAQAAFLALCASTLFNYVFAPQMWLNLAPLAIAILSPKLLKLFIVADSLNAGIMLTFFKDVDIKALLLPYVPGLSLKFDPWSLSSPVQWVAMSRNVIALIIWLCVLASALNSCREEARVEEV